MTLSAIQTNHSIVYQDGAYAHMYGMKYARY